MGILARAAAALSAFRSAGQVDRVKEPGAASLPSQGLLPTLGATPSATGLLISQGTAMSVSAVYACITIRSQDVARCTPRLFRTRKNGRREEVLDHPLARVLRQPNERQTWLEFCEQMTAAMLLRGNAYAAIIRDSRGVVQKFIPVNPDAVLILESYNGEIFYNVNRIGLWQISELRDLPPSIPADDILHLRSLSFNALVGASTIGFARDSIGVAMGLEQQTARTMANGARPSGVLQSKKPLTEDTAKRLKQQWRDYMGGLSNAGQTAVLEDGLEYKDLQLTSVDLEFMAQRNFQVTDICRFWRVPSHKVNAEQMRGVNLVQMDQDYVSNTIMPDLHRWEQRLAKDFGLDDEGLEVDFDETVLLRADITSRYNAARIGVMTGFLTNNEVRAGENLPPVDGGDVPYRPLNTAALGSDVSGEAPDGAGRPPAAEGGAGGADNVAT